MPPRLSLRALAPVYVTTTSSIPTFLVPFLSLMPQSSSQIRHASILGDLRNTPGSYSKKIRRGRGPSSGKGEKSGRGTHGQKARGKVPAHFTGGQTPEEITHGHYGFKKHPHRRDVASESRHHPILGRCWSVLNPSNPITLRELCSSRAIHGIKDGVKLLARGSTALTSAVHLVVSRASRSAIQAVEALGGNGHNSILHAVGYQEDQDGTDAPLRLATMGPRQTCKSDVDRSRSGHGTVEGKRRGLRVPSS